MTDDTPEHPIPFNDAMVRAILDGRKTQTRRVMKTRPPIGLPGDRLWVREAWANLADQQSVCGMIGNHSPDIIFRADQYEYYGESDDAGRVLGQDVKWKPSMFMPRSASRITLEITGIRFEQLQGITEDDALAEGIQKNRTDRHFCGAPHKAHGFPRQFDTATEAFADLWDSINTKPGRDWRSNPWVWVIEFERIAP